MLTDMAEVRVLGGNSPLFDTNQQLPKLCSQHNGGLSLDLLSCSVLGSKSTFPLGIPGLTGRESIHGVVELGREIILGIRLALKFAEAFWAEVMVISTS